MKRYSVLLVAILLITMSFPMIADDKSIIGLMEKALAELDELAKQNRALTERIKFFEKREAKIRCAIDFRGTKNGTVDEYGVNCPSGYSHVMNSRIYSAGQPEQWQSLCCQIFYERLP